MDFSQLAQLGLRALEFLWALLVIALTGNMIAEATNGNPSVVNFAIFCGVFAMLCLFYLIPATISESISVSPIIAIALDGLLMLFWFCCAVALAAELGVHSCSSLSYTATNKITDGTTLGNLEKRCREAQASDAFLWFGFACFAGSFVLSLLGSGGSANVRSGGMRGPGLRTQSRV